MSFGQTHIFYPEATTERCTAALLLDIDPVELVRGLSSNLEQYVNDRSYVASSLMSVAISKVFRTALSRRCNNFPDLAEHLLTHLYVLIPVLDDDKHYWVGDEEIEKLLRHGEGWLNNHPYKEKITQRYLKRRWSLAKKALAQLTEEDSQNLEAKDLAQDREEAAIEKPISLNRQRLELVAQTLIEHWVKRVIDLGCGEGKLLKLLRQNKFIEQITGVNVSYRNLEIAKKRLRLDDLPFHQRDKIELIQGSLTYRDKRFNSYDAATLIEVIEHLDSNRLAALERVVFEFAQPKLVIVATPNIEYNVLFESLPNGKLRHQDHRFEWTRQEFQAWGNDVASRFDYQITFQGIGNEDVLVGTPTQMAIFTSMS